MERTGRLMFRTFLRMKVLAVVTLALWVAGCASYKQVYHYPAISAPAVNAGFATLRHELSDKVVRVDGQAMEYQFSRLPMSMKYALPLAPGKRVVEVEFRSFPLYKKMLLKVEFEARPGRMYRIYSTGTSRFLAMKVGPRWEKAVVISSSISRIR